MNFIILVFSIKTKKSKTFWIILTLSENIKLKEYPSTIKIELKETKILAYYFDNNKKTYIGLNGKKIINKIVEEDLPLIVEMLMLKSF